MLTARLQLLVATAVLTAGHRSVTAQCVADGEYDEAVDYFPTKLASDYSTGWEVTYHNAHKVIDVGDTKIVAYQCGTPEPTDVEGATLVVQIPFDAVTLLSTTYIPFFELIGYRQTIKGISGTSSVSSPCLRDAIAAGDVSNIGSENWAPSATDINTAGAGATRYATFAGSYDVNNNLGSIDGAAIPMVETGETTGIGGAEWLEYVALFLNAEEAASTHIETVVARIDSAEQAVSATLTAAGTSPKRVLWVYEYGGSLYSGSCPNYYCEAIEKAGGEIIDLSALGDPAAYGAITDLPLFYEAAADADVWLYPGNNWDTITMDADALADLTVVQDKLVYDITRNNHCESGSEGGDCAAANDWFESRLAEPDVLLEDLINIITPEAHPDHERVWFRDVTSQSPRDTRTCSGPDDPYDLWADSIIPASPPVQAQAPVGEGASSSSDPVPEEDEAENLVAPPASGAKGAAAARGHVLALALGIWLCSCFFF